MDEGMPDGGMQDTSGMGMGETADVTVVAEAEVMELPTEPLGWTGYHVEGADGEMETYAWGPAFLYAEDEPRTLEVDGAEVILEPGQATFVEEDVEHTGADGSVWAFVLTDPGADPPPGLSAGAQQFSSGSLEGLPDGRVELRFLIVDLAPGTGRTTVHTHPGPELVYVTQGQIEYETGIQETTVLTAGDASALPADTAVQKRNDSDEPARFWSWFIVDPDEPFAAEAAFERE